jgi:hypothetical protein
MVDRDASATRSPLPHKRWSSFMHGSSSNTTQGQRTAAKRMAGCAQRSHIHHCHVRVTACVCVRQTLYELASQLSSRFGVSISRSWVCRMFRRWRWTFKDVSQKHTNKFHWNNIRAYGHFLVHVRNVPMVRIKYCDEASFASRSKCSTCSSEIHTCCTDTCYICICRYSC